MTSMAQNPDLDLDSDALFAALEAEQDLDDPSINPSYRAARLQQLSRELDNAKQATSGKDGDGGYYYKTLTSDPEVLTLTTENQRAILHFFHPGFARCSVMDSHLETLARAHAGLGGSEATVFARVDVKHAEFVVEKLGIKVLPCVIGFVGGVAKERITGFEGLMLGGNERAESVTRKIESLFVKGGVLREKRLKEGEESEDEDEEIEVGKKSGGGFRRGIKSSAPTAGDSEDDDWD